MDMEIQLENITEIIPFENVVSKAIEISEYSLNEGYYEEAVKHYWQAHHLYMNAKKVPEDVSKRLENLHFMLFSRRRYSYE